MIGFILVLGLAASVLAGRQALALLRDAHAGPLHDDPSPVPAPLLVAAQPALPMLGFLHLAPLTSAACLAAVAILPTCCRWGASAPHAWPSNLPQIQRRGRGMALIGAPQ